MRGCVSSVSSMSNGQVYVEIPVYTICFLLKLLITKQ